MCIGCSSPGFPDLVSPIYQKLPDAALPNIGSSR
jgi:Ni,Fe-hydrogenase I small subunit